MSWLIPDPFNKVSTGADASSAYPISVSLLAKQGTMIQHEEDWN